MAPKRRRDTSIEPQPRAPSAGKRVQYSSQVQGRTGTGQPRHRSTTPGRGNIREPEEPYELDNEDVPFSASSSEDEQPQPSRTRRNARYRPSTQFDYPLEDFPAAPQKLSIGSSQKPETHFDAWVAAVARTFEENREKEDNGKDVLLCDTLSDEVVAGTIKLADRYFSTDIETDGREYMHHLFANAPKQLIRYIGCLSMGGPNGVKDWEELLTKGETRRASAIGIVGRALKEHVFGDLWFGATPAEKKEMTEMEESVEFKDSLDGFLRTRKRAVVAKGFVGLGALDECGDLKLAVAQLGKQLKSMLEPFRDPGSGSGLDVALQQLILKAGHLSRLMRRAPDVVYYWPPTFKDEEFEPSRMECLNLNYMITNSPYKKKKVGGIERATLIDGKPETVAKSEAIVRVVCFPGLVAYRRCGGTLAEKEIAEEKSRKDYAPADVQAHRRAGVDALTPNTGFRSKVIFKSVVYLKWGRQRLLTKEAGTSAHIDAVKKGDINKYADDYHGFKELWDIYQDWNPTKR